MTYLALTFSPEIIEKEQVRQLINTYKSYVFENITTRLIKLGVDPLVDAPMLCGGHFRAWYKGELKNTDIDLYFKSKNEAIKVEGLFKKHCIVNIDVQNTSSIPNKHFEYDNLKYNIVTNVIGNSVIDVINKFDFAHCSCGYDLASEVFYISPLSLYSIDQGKLIINNLNNVKSRPLHVIERRYSKMVFGKKMFPTFSKTEIGITKTDYELKKLYGWV